MVNDQKLRREKSKNCSGSIPNLSQIKLLKEGDYYIIPQTLDGDAPKEFIGAYFYYKENKFFRSNKKSWSKYIAKTAEKWYPVESVTEFIINEFGTALGLRMNETELVICNGQIRFLSKYFLKKNEILLHGAEICGDYLNDRDFAKEIAVNKLEARELFTFEFICLALDKIFKSHSPAIKKDFVKMLVFDCIVGNNDRHFYNWGVIANSRKSVKRPIFAPVYDSARGLFWNQSDDKIIHFHSLLSNPGSKKIENYSKNAEPRVSLENNSKANHFDLIAYILKDNKEYEEIVRVISSVENENKIINLFRNNYCHFFIKERQEVIEKLLKIRFKTIRKLLS